jgi:hypothetical protein
MSRRTTFSGRKSNTLSYYYSAGSEMIAVIRCSCLFYCTKLASLCPDLQRFWTKRTSSSSRMLGQNWIRKEECFFLVPLLVARQAMRVRHFRAKRGIKGELLQHFSSPFVGMHGGQES